MALSLCAEGYSPSASVAGCDPAIVNRDAQHNAGPSQVTANIPVLSSMGFEHARIVLQRLSVESKRLFERISDLKPYEFLLVECKGSDGLFRVVNTLKVA